MLCQRRHQSHIHDDQQKVWPSPEFVLPASSSLPGVQFRCDLYRLFLNIRRGNMISSVLSSWKLAVTSLAVLICSFGFRCVTCQGACTTAAAIEYCNANPTIRFVGLPSTSCSRFYSCAGAQSVCQPCAPGTAFNNRGLYCDWPSNIDTATCLPKGVVPPPNPVPAPSPSQPPAPSPVTMPPSSPTPTPTSDGSYVVTSSQFSCVFLNDADIEGNVNTNAIVDKHWQFFNQAMTARNYKFGSVLEAAAFFGHIKHEYGGSLEVMTEYCSRPSQGQTCLTAYDTNNWCGASYPKTLNYFGRGPLQLSYPCNYKAMGEKLGVDLLNNPGLVADPNRDIGWQTAVGFWTIPDFNCNGRCGSLAASGQFGATTRLINPPECGTQDGRQGSRVNSYQQIRTACFGLPQETNTAQLYC